MKFICPECGELLQEKRIDAAGWKNTNKTLRTELHVLIKIDVLECPNHPGVYVIKQQDLQDFGERTWNTASLDYAEEKIAGRVDPMITINEEKMK